MLLAICPSGPLYILKLRRIQKGFTGGRLTEIPDVTQPLVSRQEIGIAITPTWKIFAGVRPFKPVQVSL